MIETNELSKRFDDLWAVDGLSLRVEAGQILALLGQNGAGKTTTVRMLTGLISPTRGWARVAGFDVTQHPNEVRAASGVLTEQHGLYLRMTGDEYLDFFGSVFQVSTDKRRARALELLRYFDIADARKRRIGEYSKGMRQKLALARALIHDPSVLLLDEPTAAMDPESAQLVRDEIARLRSAKRTIVFCTHNLAEAEALADHIVIIYRGKVLIQGSVSQLKQQVLGQPQFLLMFSRPWLVAAQDLPAGVRIVNTTATVTTLRVENPGEANPEILRAMVARAAPVVALQQAPQTLEHVYLQVMAAAREDALAA